MLNYDKEPKPEKEEPKKDEEAPHGRCGACGTALNEWGVCEACAW